MQLYNGGEMALRPKQQRFVDEYLTDLNATQAAVRAGYSRKTANRIASENLTKPDIRGAISQAQRLRSERTEVTQDRVIQEIAKIAFFDVSRMFDGKEGQTGAAVRIVSPDKLRALELLGKHLGMFKEPRQTAPASFNIDATQIARMTAEELDAGIANVDKLLAALQGQAGGVRCPQPSVLAV